MNVKLIIIDEPINITDNEKICELWRKTLWAKNISYQKFYNNSILPVNSDDFFGSHLIAANELENGDLEPIIMYKTTRFSAFRKHKTDISLLKALKGTPLENSFLIKKLLRSSDEISYHAGFTMNSKYIHHPDRKEFKDYISILCCIYNQVFNVKQWLSLAAEKYKVDEFFLANGANRVHDKIFIEVSDFEPLQLFHHPNTEVIPQEINNLLIKHSNLTNYIQIYSPTKKEKKLNLNLTRKVG